MLDALFTRTKQRVLSLIFGQPDRSFATMELIKLAGSGSGAVQRELERLVKSGLVIATVSSGQKRLTANRASPLFDELRRIVDKTAGTDAVLTSALAPLAAAIQFAVLYGSVAKGTDVASSDIDLLIVTDNLTLEEVFAALEAAEQRLGRRVSPTLYTSDEFRRRRKARHPFLTKVLSGTHVVLVGSEDAVAAG